MITLYPMYFIVIASISDPQLVSNGEIMFIPRGVSLKAYKQLLSYTRLWTGYRNTIIYKIVSKITSALERLILFFFAILYAALLIAFPFPSD